MSRGSPSSASAKRPRRRGKSQADDDEKAVNKTELELGGLLIELDETMRRLNEKVRAAKRRIGPQDYTAKASSHEHSASSDDNEYSDEVMAQSTSSSSTLAPDPPPWKTVESALPSSTEVRRLRRLLLGRDESILSFRKEKARHEQLIEALRSQNIEHEHRADILRAEISSLRDVTQDLRSRLAVSRSTTRDIIAANQGALESTQRVRSQLAAALERTEATQRKLRTVHEAKLAKAVRWAERLQRENSELQEALADARALGDQYKAEAAQLQSALDDIATKHTTHVRKARKSAAALQRETANLRKALHVASSEAELHQVHGIFLQCSIDTVGAEHARAMDRTLGQVADLRRENADLQTANSLERTMADEHRAAATRAQSAFDELRSEHNAAVSRAVERVADLQRENGRLQQDLVTTRAARNAHETAALHTQVLLGKIQSEHEIEVEVERKQNSLLREEKADLQQTLDKSRAEVSRLSKGLPKEKLDTLLDDIQQLLDYVSVLEQASDGEPGFETDIKGQILLVLYNLSRISGAVPPSLFIRGLKLVQKDPIFLSGFADIFLGRFKTQTVAVKRLRVYNNEEHLARVHREFCREALIWRQLSHPSILQFIGIDRDMSPPFMCMVSPWAEHGNILLYLSKKRADLLSININELLLQTAQGLAYLHQNSVVHGDLRGTNIFIDSEYHVRLADFGLASFSHAGLATANSSGQGSWRWMAPERLSHQESDDNQLRRSKKESDVYSFGMVCVEVYTQSQPFPDIQNEFKVRLLVCNGGRQRRPPPEKCWGKAMPDHVWRTVVQSWSQKPSDRPEMSAVVAQLTQ